MVIVAFLKYFKISYGTTIYLWGKVVCIVCHSKISQTTTSCHTFGIFRKLLMSRVALTWFEIVWNYSVKAIDHSMKIKWNWNCKLYWNLGALLVLLESPWQIKSNRFYFTIFRARVWKILIFERILLIEIQTNCKNWVWKENLVEPSMCSYLGADGIGYTSLFMKQNNFF